MTAEKDSNFFAVIWVLSFHYHLKSFHYLDENFYNLSENLHDTLENTVCTRFRFCGPGDLFEVGYSVIQNS
jgi:hypothetical protein